MQTSAVTSNPGHRATAGEIRSLADDYRLAAAAVANCGRRDVPSSRSPYPMLALHAVELYLNALLLHRCRSPEAIRGLQHDLASRMEMAVAAGLVLRVRTVAHLRAVAARREYLTSRYAPDRAGEASEPTRMAATLEEVASKVSSIVAAQPPPG